MKPSTKALMISGLGLPGAGHLYLRRFGTGLILIGTVGWALFSIVHALYLTELDILEEVQQGSVSPDVGSLTGEVIQRTGEVMTSLQLEYRLIIGAWLFGILDSYRIGRKREFQPPPVPSLK